MSTELDEGFPFSSKDDRAEDKKKNLIL